ncbi:MAG TPA: FGGY family carbohydrate kinase [Longilinea sp.]|nr:FGGY family carbohydrate kinase [Longilinea sp.]
MDVVIGLDIGTSSVKAAAYDLFGRELTTAFSPMRVITPNQGWAEQEPDEWWRAVCICLSKVVKSIKDIHPLAIGLSGQCPGHVLVGKDGKPMGSAIIWRDARAQAEAQWITENISSEEALRWTGTSFLGEATMPPARLLWLSKFRSMEWEQARYLFQPKDFIAFLLTGEAATDLHSAYSLYNIQKGEYDRQYFSRLNTRVEIMPPVFKPTHILGQVNSEAAALTGVPEGTQVVIGTIDAYCDCLAGGVILPGVAVDVAGTSEIVALGTHNSAEGEGVFHATIGEEGHFLIGPTQAGGDTLRWFSQGFFPEITGSQFPAVIEQAARSIQPGADGVVFLPYLNGERAPIWDADATACFIGMSLANNRNTFARAVYEGVAYVVRHIVEISSRVSGTEVEKLVVCGGGANSGFWNQIKADVTGITVARTEQRMTGCLGSAMLATIGIGISKELSSSVQQMVRLSDHYQPDAALHQIYNRAYAKYCLLYPALKPLFHLKEA